MTANRFEQVDEAVDDAITLTLGRHDGQDMGIVHCPKSANDKLPADLTSQPVAAKHALGGAIDMANEMKLALVVVDREGVWDKEWGELYRWEESGDADGSGE